MSANSYLSKGNFSKDEKGQMNSLIVGVGSSLITIAFIVIILFTVLDAGEDAIDENNTDAVSSFSKLKSMATTIIALLILIPLVLVGVALIGIFAYQKMRG
jgi:Na+/H+ antiporter NhaC